MTAVEVLLASNLDADDALIRPKREYEKIRRQLRRVISKCLRDSGLETDAAAGITTDLNERLADLNRRSFMDKLQRLADRWGVRIDDLGYNAIQEAKRARDHVVHTGHHGTADSDADSLRTWRHAMVIREIAVRLIFATLGYSGSYTSYVGGYHQSTYPKAV
jgi:hypothetical protein